MNRHLRRLQNMLKRSLFWIVCFLLLMPYGATLGIERRLLVGPVSYPQWLANSSPRIRTGLVRDFHDQTCGNEPVEVHLKPTQIVLRCGTWRPHSHTAILPRNTATERLVAEY